MTFNIVIILLIRFFVSSLQLLFPLFTTQIPSFRLSSLLVLLKFILPTNIFFLFIQIYLFLFSFLHFFFFQFTLSASLFRSYFLSSFLFFTLTSFFFLSLCFKKHSCSNHNGVRLKLYDFASTSCFIIFTETKVMNPLQSIYTSC